MLPATGIIYSNSLKVSEKVSEKESPQPDYIPIIVIAQV